jgi:hypothetical protein
MRPRRAPPIATVRGSSVAANRAATPPLSASSREESEFASNAECATSPSKESAPKSLAEAPTSASARELGTGTARPGTYSPRFSPR